MNSDVNKYPGKMVMICPNQGLKTNRGSTRKVAAIRDKFLPGCNDKISPDGRREKRKKKQKDGGKKGHKREKEIEIECGGN